MKNLVKFIILICCNICFLGACKENQQDGKKPEPIEKYSVTLTHGGAIITYIIPKDPDILYVLAEYERNGKPFTERSSAFINSLSIEGFDTKESVNANLFTVNRNEIKSDPLKIVFTPLESPVSLAGKSAEVVPAFGGIMVSWENNGKSVLALRVMVDEDGKKVEKAIHFSEMASAKYTFRGFESVETSFALTFEDRWGNISDTVFYIGVPLPEVLIPKPYEDLRRLIPYDNITDLSATYAFSKLFDNIIGVSSRYLSVSGSTGSSMTFDFGQVVKLSRWAMWPGAGGQGTRPGGEDVYGEVNVHEVEMWGTALAPIQLPVSNTSYWLHPYSANQNSLELPERTFMDDWVYLGRYAIERLDLMGASEAEIAQKGGEGHHFDIPFECGPVRIIRFFPLCTREGCPPPNNYWQMGELSFWGDTTISQDESN